MASDKKLRAWTYLLLSTVSVGVLTIAENAVTAAAGSFEGELGPFLGEGSFDIVPLARTLREMDYQGPLGTMGYTQSGDIPGKLNRANQAWEGIKQEALKP